MNRRSLILLSALLTGAGLGATKGALPPDAPVADRVARAKATLRRIEDVTQELEPQDDPAQLAQHWHQHWNNWDQHWNNWQQHWHNWHQHSR